MEGDLVVNSRVTIGRDELTYRFSRSGGPGGQNVNKLETRVEALLDLQRTGSLSDEDKALVRARLAGYIDADGQLRVTVSETRSQRQNREIAAQRLVEVLRKALRRRRSRRATRPPASAVEARLDDKKRRGTLKRVRGEVSISGEE